MAEEWSYFIVKLNTNFIKLVEEVDDSLCWSQNLAIRVFLAKLGYKVQDEFEFVSTIVCWLEIIWKLLSMLNLRFSYG